MTNEGNVRVCDPASLTRALKRYERDMRVMLNSFPYVAAKVVHFKTERGVHGTVEIEVIDYGALARRGELIEQELCTALGIDSLRRAMAS